LFVCAPLAAVVAAGASADFVRLAGENAVRRAFITSFAVAGASSALCLLMAVCVVMARHALGSARPLRRLMRSMLAASASLVLLVPPAVLGAGWFVLLIGRGDVFSAAPVIVVAVNALMALPFVMRVLDPAFQVHAARTGRLSAALGLTGWRRLWLIDGPALRPSLIAAFAFAMALSLGDLGVIALFGSQDVATLPYLLLQRMGSYRTDDAAGLALVLGAMCLLFMALGTRRHGAGA
jgi:thiamine transport system permease protein